MLRGKKFLVINGKGDASSIFELKDGLQQGAVNSPILFNIFIYDLLTLFGINDNPKIKGIAFADDIIIYMSNPDLETLRIGLEKLFRNVLNYFHTWKLKCNVEKCETILFRPKMSEVKTKYLKVWRDFNIKPEEEKEPLNHKTCVKYLGTMIDEQLKFTTQFKNMISKARATFFSNSKLFYSKMLNKKVKLLCYILLVRPHYTYACQNWFNLSAVQMEKIRVFERQCLRVCLNLNRERESNYQKRTSTKTIYNNAKLTRIDIFIIKLIRQHIKKAIESKNNYISKLYHKNIEYYKQTLSSGYIPHETFIFLDYKGYIQDIKNIPYFYHIKRHAIVRTITYNPREVCNPNDIDVKYTMNLPNCDKKDSREKRKRDFDWLNEQFWTNE